jgi:hypothetical protein
VKIETWNITTLENNYHIDILTEKFRRFELDLLGVSETHITGVGNMKLGDIEFIYSGWKDGVHRQGVELMKNKEAAKSYLGWGGINNRILIAHFINIKFRVSVVVVHAPVEPKNCSLINQKIGILRLKSCVAGSLNSLTSIYPSPLILLPII